MKGKMELFLSGNYKPELLAKLKKDVSLIKLEAERLNIPFESYHPYYILVYSYLKEMFKEGIIVNDKCARGKFHRIWLLADETSALRNSNENQPWTEYGKAVMEQRNSSEVYAIEKLQYDRNIKRLDLIVESIRFQAKSAKLTEIGILGRLTFFYHSLCFQDPCFTMAMNEIWVKLNHDLCDEKFVFTYDTKRLLADVIRKTFNTDIKCFMCMFGTGTYSSEPDFYYHIILSHTSFRMICNVPKCEFKAVNRIKMDNHIISQHDDLLPKRKPLKCEGCGKWHLTLAEVSACEDECAISSNSKLSIYYWEKYYLIWSGQVDDDFTLDQYFFSRQSSGNDEGKVTEPQVDESLFNVSFGSDFECSWDEPKIDENEGKKKEELEDQNAVSKVEENEKVVDVKDEVEIISPAKLKTAKEVMKEEEKSVSTKRKESSTPELTDLGQVKRALVEQKEFFSAEFGKLDEKLDQVIGMVKTIKDQLEKQ